MSNAAFQQALDIGKEKLRDFLENSETGRQALGMKERADAGEGISLQTLDSKGRRKARMQKKMSGSAAEDDSEGERDF